MTKALCRRAGEKLFLKGDRCYSNKCAIESATSPPAWHPARKVVEVQHAAAREAEAAGLLERQFRNYFREGAATKGVTGTTLLQLLERRLDNVVYRLGFTTSRAQARQLIRHSHFEVNGKKVSIPSYLCGPGDRVAPRGKSKDLFIIKEAIKNVDARQAVPYLDLDTNKLEGTFTEIPGREVIPVPVEEQLIVELYSK